MGCVNSKKAVARAASASPVGPYVVQSSSRKRTSNVPSSAAVSVVVAEPPPPAPSAPPPVTVSASASRSSREHLRSGSVVVSRKSDAKPEVEEWKKGSLSRRLGLSSSSSGRFVEAEQNAAGWPSWLTSIAGEAIHGWVPLKTESFEKLDKVGLQQPFIFTFHAWILVF